MRPEFSMHDLAAGLEAEIASRKLLNVDVAWRDEIVFPRYDGLSIRNVPQSVMDLLGVEGLEAPLDARVWGQGGRPDVDRVVLILSDGLGYRLLRDLAAEDTAVAEDIATITQARGFVPLTSTFPSTTAVALPTLWTGATPGEHGMVGTTMFLRELSMIINMLWYAPLVGKHRSGILDEWGYPGEAFVDYPGVGKRLADQGVRTHLILEKSLMGTGLSKILHRGVQGRHPTVGLNDTWKRIKDVLQETRGQRCYVSAYISNVDSLSHFYGSRSPHVLDEIRYQLKALRQILTSPDVQDGRTLVMILADHGHHDISYALDLYRDTHGQRIIDAMRVSYAGDACAAHVFTRDGYRDQVMDGVRAHYADSFVALDTAELVEKGLYGSNQFHPELMFRLGDLTLLARGGSMLADQAHLPPMSSFHSGLSAAEMLVPFLHAFV